MFDILQSTVQALLYSCTRSTHNRYTHTQLHNCHVYHHISHDMYHPLFFCALLKTVTLLYTRVT